MLLCGSPARTAVLDLNQLASLCEPLVGPVLAGLGPCTCMHHEVVAKGVTSRYPGASTTAATSSSACCRSLTSPLTTLLCLSCFVDEPSRRGRQAVCVCSLLEYCTQPRAYPLGPPLGRGAPGRLRRALACVLSGCMLLLPLLLLLLAANSVLVAGCASPCFKRATGMH